MGLQTINLRKDKGRVVNTVVKDIFIQTIDNFAKHEELWHANPTDPNATKYGWLNAGFIKEASVKVNAKPRGKKLVDGATLSKGWDCSFEIVSLQYYHLFEFEKFNNQRCCINLSGVNTCLINVPVQVELDATFNEDGDAEIKLTGTIKVDKLNQFISPNDWWNPTDTPVEPWESGTASPSDSPDITPPVSPSGGATINPAMLGE